MCCLHLFNLEVQDILRQWRWPWRLHLRKQLQREYGDEYARFLELMGRIRKRLLKGRRNADQPARERAAGPV